MSELSLESLFPENAVDPRPRHQAGHRTGHRSPSGSGHHGTGKRRSRGGRPRHRLRRRLLVAGGVLVVLALVVVGGTTALVSSFYSSNVHVMASDPFPRVRAAVPANGSENILLLGSDTRGATLGDVSSGAATGQRSDTMLLVHIPSDHHDVEVMSIMRDLWVPVPGHGNAKINAAFSYGGVPLAVQTVEQLLSTRIDHVAIVDFDGFAQMSTDLGGVDVDSPKAFTSRNMRGYTFTKGTNHVEGQAALAFVRERYAFPDSDYQRVRDQQSFLRGVVGKVTGSGPTDVASLTRFAGTALDHTTVDPGLTATAVLSLLTSLRSLDGSDVHFFTLPTDGTGTSPGGQSIVVQDPAATAAISSAMSSGSLASYLIEHDLQNGQ